jgi:predicted  nucleic acid-binding Zn-ribbon protein
MPIALSQEQNPAQWADTALREFPKVVDTDAAIEKIASTTSDAEDLMPPFRSARDFPIAPKEEKLGKLYKDCREALIDANTARSFLRQRMTRKKEAISAIRAEIESLEKDLAIEAATRMKLHAMNEQLVEALHEMEQIAEDVSTTIAEAHGGRRTALKALVDKLKLLVRNWRGFKSSQRAKVARVLPSVHHGERNP